MSRIVSVWVPRWQILRFLAAQAKKPSQDPIDPEQPFVLAVTASGGPRIAAVNEAAEAAGLALGESLADARAKVGFLQVRAVDAAADGAALNRLALWATRYTPTASPWSEENGADGFFLDIAGAAHLFGGEEKLLVDLADRLQGSFGLPARLAVADTPGAAWALSRFHPAPCCILPSGAEAAALAPLPVEALRLLPATCATLRRLGLKTVGTLLERPRAPFASRFAAELRRRLDQALGRVDEPLVPIVTPPVYHSLRYLLEPVFTQEAVLALTNRLMANLVHVLTRDDVGARALRLSLYRVDGEVKTIDIALTLPTRSVPHVARMIDLKLEALAATQDAGFGFEAIGLAVTRAEPMPARQTALTALAEDADRTERCAALVDALRQRLGPRSVRRFAAVASHLPERVEILETVAAVSNAARPRASGDPVLDSRLRGNERGTAEREAFPWPPSEQHTRPLVLLPQAEPTEVTALIPDGPPRRFRWRGETYDVAGAQGPERIASEWWRQSMPNVCAYARDSERPHALTRDYYLVEDAHGHRFWLFREGLYGRETAAARWFVHGLFA
jgi:protein ImuB